MKINEKLSYENIDGQIVVMNDGDEFFNNSKALILNHTATYIFDCLQNNLTEYEIINELIKEFAIDKNIAETDLKECIIDFRNKRILIDD